MDGMLASIAGGFASLLDPLAIIFMLVGVVLGMIFGALPGLSATTGMAMLLPIAYSMDVTIGLLMLGGIYAGAPVWRIGFRHFTWNPRNCCCTSDYF